MSDAPAPDPQASQASPFDRLIAASNPQEAGERLMLFKAGEWWRSRDESIPFFDACRRIICPWLDDAGCFVGGEVTAFRIDVPAPTASAAHLPISDIAAGLRHRVIRTLIQGRLRIATQDAALAFTWAPERALNLSPRNCAMDVECANELAEAVRPWTDGVAAACPTLVSMAFEVPVAAPSAHEMAAALRDA